MFWGARCRGSGCTSGWRGGGSSWVGRGRGGGVAAAGDRERCRSMQQHPGVWTSARTQTTTSGGGSKRRRALLQSRIATTSKSAPPWAARGTQEEHVAQRRAAGGWRFFLSFVRQPNKSSWEGWQAYAWSGGWAVPTGVLRPSLGRSTLTGTDLAKSLEPRVAHRPRTATHPTGGVDAPTGASLGNGVVAATPRSSSACQHTHGRVEATPLHLTWRGWGLRLQHGRHCARASTAAYTNVIIGGSLRRCAAGTGATDALAPHGGGAARVRRHHGGTGLLPLLHCYSGDGCTCFSHRASCAAEAPSPCRVHSRSDGHTWLLSGRARP